MNYFLSLFLHGLLIVTGLSWAFRALSAGGLMEFNLLEISNLSLPVNIDSLSAFFLAVISLTFLTGILYAYGYLKLYRQTQSDRQFSLHYFSLLWLHISLILACTLREGIAFLCAWALMSAAVFILVIFERERKGIVKTGLSYLLQMQLGILLILTAFLMARHPGHPFGFDSLDAYFASHDVLPLFALLFTGFSLFAGFVPLHTGLPSTQLAAPSHVSGIMSGVLVQMGLYGILRVLTYIHSNLIVIGILILLVSLLTGILGIRSAFRQHDGKLLLVYSSIANTGITGIGVGVGLLGIAFDTPALAALGFTGGILHLANHALSKSLLFYSMGSVYRATQTRSTEQLGGLFKTMPKTTLAFLIGLLALCGLPPFNGFVSEFMIYAGLIKGLGPGAGLLNAIIWLTIGGLAFISLYNLFGFTRFFETAFLDPARSTTASHAREVADTLMMPKILAGICILIIGFFPSFFIKLTSQVTALYVTDLKPLTEINLSLIYTGLIGTALVGLSMVVIWMRSRHQKPVKLMP